MSLTSFEIESGVPFSESIIWQYNRDYYLQKGIAAWSDSIVPHNVTSNSSIASNYAKLIFCFLKDINEKHNSNQPIYILELGAGHGRLCFHILQHLKKMITDFGKPLPPYCYVLTDFVKDNISFYNKHPQFQAFFESGELDVAFFDAENSNSIELVNSKVKIVTNFTQNPIFVIANYFFDSLPNELYFLKDNVVYECTVKTTSTLDPSITPIDSLLESINLTFENNKVKRPFHNDSVLNQILMDYSLIKEDTYIFFPKVALNCISRIRKMSSKGVVLLTMDKGYHKLVDLIDLKSPDIVKHGSFSFLVNLHALKEYCRHISGKALFRSRSNYSIELACLIMTDGSNAFAELVNAYDECVEHFSPDDFNILKKMFYAYASTMEIKELISIYRFSKYDSSIFINLLPRLKQLLKTISIKDRDRFEDILELVWVMYFNIDERIDLSYELGIISYDLAYFKNAIIYFQHSIDHYGIQIDVIYNQALCYYQLREDELFYDTLKRAKTKFPNSEVFRSLESLDMS